MASIVFKGIRQITTSEYESLVQTNPTAVAGTLFFVRDSATDEIGKIYFGTRCYSSNNYYTKEEIDSDELVVSSALTVLNDKVAEVSGATESFAEDITELQGRVDNTYTKEELDDAHYVISSSLNDLNSRIGTISSSTDTNEYVIAEALTDLDSRVSDIEDGYLANAGGDDSSFSGSFNDLTDLPTTLAGYGITDAYISGNYIYLGNNSLYVPTSITGNYLPLSGGTLTGTVNTRTLRPSSNSSTYTLGESNYRYYNIYSKGLNVSGTTQLSGTTQTQIIEPFTDGSYSLGNYNKRYNQIYANYCNLTSGLYVTGTTRTQTLYTRNIYPETDATYTIGTTSSWSYKEIYLKGTGDTAQTPVLQTLKDLQSTIGDIETILASI